MPPCTSYSQPQKEHQEGSLLDHLQYYCWKQGSNSGRCAPAFEQVLFLFVHSFVQFCVFFGELGCTPLKKEELCMHLGLVPLLVALQLLSSNHTVILVLFQAIIDANIIPPLVSLLATAEFDIKKEAAWAISNATSGGTHEQIKYVVH